MNEKQVKKSLQLSGLDSIEQSMWRVDHFNKGASPSAVVQNRTNTASTRPNNLTPNSSKIVPLSLLRKNFQKMLKQNTVKQKSPSPYALQVEKNRKLLLSDRGAAAVGKSRVKVGFFIKRENAVFL